jgi:hypothetical protein
MGVGRVCMPLHTYFHRQAQAFLFARFPNTQIPFSCEAMMLEITYLA